MIVLKDDHSEVRDELEFDLESPTTVQEGFGGSFLLIEGFHSETDLSLLYRSVKSSSSTCFSSSGGVSSGFSSQVL